MIDYIRITPEGHIRVTSAAPFDYIVSYTALPDINKMVGDPIALPNTVVATRKSGAVETLIVKWEPASTEVAGTFYISGSIGNGAGVVTQKVIVSQLSDLDILRQIRDANPTSQLPTLWLDSEDPYTQWEGIVISLDKVRSVSIGSRGVTSLNGINKLKSVTSITCPNNSLTTLDLSNMPLLGYVNCGINQISILSISNTPSVYQLQAWSNKLTGIDLSLIQDKLQVLEVDHNKITSIPSLTYKNPLYTYIDFRNNLMQPTETDRLIALGFTTGQVLPQDI